MSANLINDQSLFKTAWPESKRIRLSLPVVKRLKHEEPIRRLSNSQVKDDEEIRFVTNAMTWMAVAVMAPLILLYAIMFFYPDIFMISAST